MSYVAVHGGSIWVVFCVLYVTTFGKECISGATQQKALAKSSASKAFFFPAGAEGNGSDLLPPIERSVTITVSKGNRWLRIAWSAFEQTFFTRPCFFPYPAAAYTSLYAWQSLPAMFCLCTKLI